MSQDKLQICTESSEKRETELSLPYFRIRGRYRISWNTLFIFPPFTKGSNSYSESTLKETWRHNSGHAIPTQCFNSDKKSTIGNFMYKQKSRDFNFTIFTSCISTSSTIRSWIVNEDGETAGDYSMLARLSMNISHVTWSKIIWLPRLSLINIFTDPTLIPISRYL